MDDLAGDPRLQLVPVSSMGTVSSHEWGKIDVWYACTSLWLLYMFIDFKNWVVDVREIVHLKEKIPPLWNNSLVQLNQEI